MDIPVDRWIEVIPIRRSRRRYTGEGLKKATAEEIKRICTDFRPFDGARSVFVSNPPDDVFRGAVGSYGKIKGAQSYIAFIGNTTIPGIEAKVGYTGEGVVLETTALGVGTCWVAAFFDPRQVAKHITLAENERVYAVTPVGYTSQKWVVEEKIMTGLNKGLTRKPLEVIAENYSEEAWPDWAKQGMQCSRWAPSAVNRQPWRFRYNRDEVIVSTDGRDTFKISKALDCGIAMLHFELGARANGFSGSWEFLEAPEVAKWK